MLIRFSLRKVAVAAALNFAKLAFEGEVDLSSPFLLIQWAVFIPLIGLGINLLFGRKLGEKASGWSEKGA